jgi:uncharacterized cupin superfamily protein
MIINSQELPDQTNSNYPEVFKHLVDGRKRKRLGQAAGLTQFGVNLVQLAPGSCSSIRHYHSKQDEFVYILQGEITLVTNDGETILIPGQGAGFPAGEADGHHLINRSDELALYLEIGSRTEQEQVNYPDLDLIARFSVDQGWKFMHKNGTAY